MIRCGIALVLALGALGALLGFALGVSTSRPAARSLGADRHAALKLEKGVVDLSYSRVAAVDTQITAHGFAVAGFEFEEGLEIEAGFPTLKEIERRLSGASLCPAWHVVSVRVPLWFVAAVCLVYPTLRFNSARRRIPSDRCQKCGYDLTGNVSGRCPECGQDIAAPAP